MRTSDDALLLLLQASVALHIRRVRLAWVSSAGLGVAIAVALVGTDRATAMAR